MILNADDPAVAAMAAKTAARVVRVSRTVGAEDWADVWATDVVLDELARPRFTLHASGEQADVTLAVHGDHQVSNALCAAAVALQCGPGWIRWSTPWRQPARCRSIGCRSAPATTG